MDQPTNDAASAQVAELLGQILERVDAIDRRQADLEARLAALDEEARPTVTPTGEAPSEAPTEAAAAPEPARPGVSRRMLLTGAAGLTAAGVAVVAGATPAAATNGQPILAGQNNTATAATTVSASGGATSAIDAINTNPDGAGLYAQTRGSSGYSGLGYLGSVIGDSQNIRGVVGTSFSSQGVAGTSAEDIGVYGYGGYGGVLALSERVALTAQSLPGTAILASSENVHIRFGGSTRTPPISDTTSHIAGAMVFDENATLWFCVAPGTPGTWRRITGPSSAGSFHVLPAPARIYDSRPGTAPAVGSKTPLNNTPRVLSCNVNSSGVPAGATAVALTILLVNAANTNGNMTVWANGAARPQANTMVWGAGSGRYTSSTISAVDAQTRIQVVASAATDVVIDVLGYYR